MNEQKILELLMPAILHIDSGCKPCIEGFCERANAALKENQSLYRYEFDEGSYTQNLDEQGPFLRLLSGSDVIAERAFGEVIYAIH